MVVSVVNTSMNKLQQLRWSFRNNQLFADRCRFNAATTDQSLTSSFQSSPTSQLSSSIAQYSSSDNSSGGRSPLVTLYQYKICPFCNETKALLAYSGTQYETVEVNPLTKREIRRFKDYKKVPIATIDETPYFGSDTILHGLLEHPHVRKRLERRWVGSSRAGTTMDMTKFAQYPTQWTTFAKDELAPLLYPNMCRTWGDAYDAFGYVNDVPEFGPLQRFSIRTVGSLAMYLAASRVKKRRNITDEREALNEYLSLMETDGLRAGSPFLSQALEPDLGDLAVYGTLRSIEGLPAHDEAVHHRGGILRDWYNRMKQSVEHPQA